MDEKWIPQRIAWHIYHTHWVHESRITFLSIILSSYLYHISHYSNQQPSKYILVLDHEPILIMLIINNSLRAHLFESKGHEQLSEASDAVVGSERGRVIPWIISRGSGPIEAIASDQV
jgi:uncharacterized membrane protein